MFVQRGTQERVGLRALFYTGCRPCELSRFDPKNRVGNYQFWNPRKSQKGYRKEYLPDDFWREVYECKNKIPTLPNKIIHISGDTLRRYFNRDIRPYLSAEWQEKVTVMRKGRIIEEYRYSLKSFRKTFATLIFYHFYMKYNDAGVALEKTAKRMCHSTQYMTAHHYLEEMKHINITAYKSLMPYEVLDNHSQKKIFEYL